MQTCLADHAPARHRTRRLAAVMALAGLLGACAAQQPSRTDYADYERRLTELGDLRTDTAPPDAPYSNDDLVRNFSRIALRHEVNIERAGNDGNAAENPLQRWEGPIRYRLFGEGVTPADEAETERFLRGIAQITGLDIARARRDFNLMILITEPGERDRVSADLRRFYPAFADGFDTWRRSNRVVCMATNVFSEDDPDVIVFGMVVLGSEVTGVLRRSCLHEEIAQALGLGNDHPDVRPSIFNDDEEFALLTEHDEWLLRILYDGRLQAGMTEDEAMPVVRAIVSELRPRPGITPQAVAIAPDDEMAPEDETARARGTAAIPQN